MLPRFIIEGHKLNNIKYADGNVDDRHRKKTIENKKVAGRKGAIVNVCRFNHIRAILFYDLSAFLGLLHNSTPPKPPPGIGGIFLGYGHF